MTGKIIIAFMFTCFILFLCVSVYHRYKFDYYHEQYGVNASKFTEYFTTDREAAREYNRKAHLYLDSMKLMRDHYFYPFIK